MMHKRPSIKYKHNTGLEMEDLPSIMVQVMDGLKEVGDSQPQEFYYIKKWVDMIKVTPHVGPQGQGMTHPFSLIYDNNKKHAEASLTSPFQPLIYLFWFALLPRP